MSIYNPLDNSEDEIRISRLLYKESNHIDMDETIAKNEQLILQLKSDYKTSFSNLNRQFIAFKDRNMQYKKSVLEELDFYVSEIDKLLEKQSIKEAENA